MASFSAIPGSAIAVGRSRDSPRVTTVIVTGEVWSRKSAIPGPVRGVV
jgi:hypothetical protein